MKLLPNPYGLMATRHDTTEDADDNAAYLPALTHECAQAGLDLQLTDDPAVDLPEFKVINGRRTCVARSDELGVALDEVRLTYRAAAAYIAGKLYDEALTTSRPAETLDDIADDLPEVMTEVFQATDTAPVVAAVLLSPLTDYVWAYTAVEHARAETDPGYRYAFELLTDALKKGAHPATVRADARRVAEHLRNIAGGSR